MHTVPYIHGTVALCTFSLIRREDQLDQKIILVFNVVYFSFLHYMMSHSNYINDNEHFKVLLS